MAWVDLGDLYVKKAGDNVTGSIVMANNNLSVAYDAGTTYNVGTEIKSLRDSVSQVAAITDGLQKIFVGTEVFHTWTGDGQLQLWTNQEFINNFGRSFRPTRDCVLAMNGDAANNNHYLSGVSYYEASSSLWVKTWDGGGSGPYRVNYVVVLRDS